MSAYVKQVGGSHYYSADDQHWDLMDRWDIEYLPATASKYVARYDRKGTPKLDLEKSISYLTKQLACHPSEGCRRLIYVADMTEWCKTNDISDKKKTILELIHVDGSPRALRWAIQKMKDIVDADYPG